jgi:hypothetical protein
MGLNDHPTNGKPYSGPGGLCRKKRFEDTFLTPSPIPESSTVTTTSEDSWTKLVLTCKLRARSVTEFMASIAFEIKFRNICCNWPRSPDS